MSHDTKLPPSLLLALDEAPRDRPVALLLRHAERPPIPPGEVGNDLPLTPVGVRHARALGEWLGGRLVGLRASPLPRCTQTAAALSEGAGVDLPIPEDRLLGDPGGYILDGQRAWETFGRMSLLEIAAHLAAGRDDLPGFAAPRTAARGLIEHLFEHASERAGVHAFVTHDLLVAVTAAMLLDLTPTADDWPGYLEGALLWREGPQLHLRYRDRTGRRRSPW